jgi:Zn-dependent protease
MDLAQFLTTVSIAAIPIVFAITVHEVAHGLVARQFGDRTAEMQGRLSLNPIRHIDPIGTVVVPVILLWFGGFLFGWARPVPVDSRNMRNPRSNMVWVTAAGPAANVLMALIWALLMLLAQRFGGGTASDWIEQMAWVGIWFNVVLAVFNMLPIPPLDGGQVLTNLLPRGPLSTLLERIAPYGLFIVLGLVATGLLSPIIARPVRALIGMIAGIFALQLG